MPNDRMQVYRRMTEDYLQTCFSDESAPQNTLYSAMRYSLLAGGKRIRPVLVLEFCRLCGGDVQKALPFAAAIEMVHTYSLIHDDLPCMDNDDYRRGRLTNHKVYGEATAVLAGDALLTAAFSTLASAKLDAARIAAGTRILADAAGENGMVGGQILDLEGEEKQLGAAEIMQIHRLKTGALIRAACCLGVAAAGGTKAQMDAAARYAEALGLAFQIQDDILDVIGDAAKLGKATQHDEKKSTFVSLYGVDTCEKMVQEQTQNALTALDVFDDTAFLREMTAQLATRDH